MNSLNPFKMAGTGHAGGEWHAPRDNAPAPLPATPYAYEAADPRTYGEAEAIAYLREERERASKAFQRRFDAPAAPRPCSALEALHTGDWPAFFDACCAPSDAPF